MKLGVLAALDQRIGLRYAMPPMTSEETGSYLRHHVGLAGRSDPLFSDDAPSDTPPTAPAHVPDICTLNGAIVCMLSGGQRARERYDPGAAQSGVDDPVAIGHRIARASGVADVALPYAATPAGRSDSGPEGPFAAPLLSGGARIDGAGPPPRLRPHLPFRTIVEGQRSCR